VETRKGFGGNSKGWPNLGRRKLLVPKGFLTPLRKAYSWLEVNWLGIGRVPGGFWAIKISHWGAN